VNIDHEDGPHGSEDLANAGTIAVRVVNALTKRTGLSPSEALAVVRRARQLDGDLFTNLPAACEVVAADFDDRALVHRASGAALHCIAPRNLADLEREA